MSAPRPIYGGGYGLPEYREVEEYGRTKFVLMRKGWATTTVPAHSRPVLTAQTDAHLTFELEYVPKVVTGRSWWEKV